MGEMRKGLENAPRYACGGQRGGAGRAGTCCSGGAQRVNDVRRGCEVRGWEGGEQREQSSSLRPESAGTVCPKQNPQRLKSVPSVPRCIM